MLDVASSSALVLGAPSGSQPGSQALAILFPPMPAGPLAAFTNANSRAFLDSSLPFAIATSLMILQGLSAFRIARLGWRVELVPSLHSEAP